MTGPADVHPSIDLNADLGEGFGAWGMGDDDALLDIVTSANVACGFHAGDARIMRRTCDAAVVRGVAIGAHVSYRDLHGFGRRDVEIAPDDLRDDVLYQIGALDTIARAAGSRVRYVKAHGALYNRCAHDREHAAALVEAVVAHGGDLALLAAPGSAAASLAAERGVRCVAEAFVDRAYRADATLVPRREPGAVLETTDASVAQALSLALHHTARTLTGGDVEVHAASLCVHGDTPHAVATARAVREALAAHGVDVRSFV